MRIIERFRESVSHAATEIRHNGGDLYWWEGRARDRINKPFQNAVWPGRKGLDVPSEDWDVLIVLDACRADTFETVVDRSRFDAYRREISQASMTREWLRTVWPDEYGDIVYVAGNPMVSKEAPGRWNQLVEAWREGLDQNLAQVEPARVAELGVESIENHTDKRIVVHFMQPHAPFIGHQEMQFDAWDLFENVGAGLEGVDNRAQTVWDAAAAGLVDEFEVWKAYRDNLRVAMPHVQSVLEALTPGTKAVVTSDHGNVINARSFPVPYRMSGHPAEERHPGLVTVPWAEFTAGRRTVSDGGVQSYRVDDEVDVAERLQMLGYDDEVSN